MLTHWMTNCALVLGYFMMAVGGLATTAWITLQATDYIYRTFRSQAYFYQYCLDIHGRREAKRQQKEKRLAQEETQRKAWDAAKAIQPPVM